MVQQQHPSVTETVPASLGGRTGLLICVPRPRVQPPQKVVVWEEGTGSPFSLQTRLLVSTTSRCRHFTSGPHLLSPTPDPMEHPRGVITTVTHVNIGTDSFF